MPGTVQAKVEAVSDVSGTARWIGPSAGTAPPRKVWLAGVIALVSLLVLGNLAGDVGLDVRYGWDVRVNCAAVEAHANGLDPYYVRNLKGTRLSYPYLPVTLDVFRPLCAGGFLVTHYRGLYLALAVLCGLLLPGLAGPRGSRRDTALRCLCTLGAFVGFEWVQASGNFAILSGLLTAMALAMLLRPTRPDGAAVRVQTAGAALLGLVMSFKLVFCPVLAALYLLPLPRRRKLALLGASAIGFMIPILISAVAYPDLFASWLLAIKGQIPDQHVVQLDETNPSLLLFARSLAAQAGLAGSWPVVFGAYGLAALAVVLVPFALSLPRDIRSGTGSTLQRLDRWLIDHPHAALRFTMLAMYGLYLCSPRLKEYAFFELALYAAVLIVELPAASLAAVLVIGIATPALVSLFGNAFQDSFGQLGIALACFWILLLDLRAGPARRASERGDP
jgi:hypothetical protein